MGIVQTLSHQSTELLSSIKFKSSIISILTHCLPILFTNICVEDKNRMRNSFKDTDPLHIEMLKTWTDL